MSTQASAAPALRKDNGTVPLFSVIIKLCKTFRNKRFLEKGKIVEEGTHEMLLKLHKGTYQKLWQIQAGGFN